MIEPWVWRAATVLTILFVIVALIGFAAQHMDDGDER